MSNDPVEMWIKAAVPPGSGRYYACVHESNPQYTATILTLYSIWSKLCFSNREIDVATRQMEWWQKELTAPRPQHPVTIALRLADPEQYDLTCQRLTMVVSGYTALLTEGSPSRAPSAKNFHHKTGAIAARIIAGPAIGDQYEPPIEFVGIALSKFRCVRYAHQHAANGLLCLPFESMSEAGVSPSELIPGQYSDQLQAFLQHQLSDINKDFETFFSEATGDSAFRFLYVYTKLQQLLLTRYQSDLSLLDNPGYRLLPLKNFWHSYKAIYQQKRR